MGRERMALSYDAPPNAPHPFWERLHGLILRGKLANVDIEVWFEISEGTARLWRKAQGSYGPSPRSAQGAHWERLHLLRDAIADGKFPLVGLRIKSRQHIVKQILDAYTRRVPKGRSS